MAHSLIPERMLVVSPSLAATIGLEEAIMLQALNDGGQSGQDQWRSIGKSTLRSWLPFWPDLEIKRILKSLADKGIVHFNSPPFPQSEQLFFSFEAQPAKNPVQQAYKKAEAQFKNVIAANWQPNIEILRYIEETLGIPKPYAMQQVQDFVYHYQAQGTLAASWESMFVRWVKKRKEEDQSNPAIFQQDAGRKFIITMNWKPEATTLDILHRAGVDPNFIQDCVSEFVLFWMEKGEAHDTWNTKFVAWVRRQWARYTASIANPTDPVPMQDGWQPNEDVYEILAMANIDRAYVQSLVAEFALYWRDSKQLHTSWNSKFLQYAKQQWSKRLNGQTGSSAATSQRDYAANTSIEQRVKDLSWADGL